MKELKADAYLERLDQLQRKYTSIDYRLSLLIEQETKTPGTSLHELFTREQAAEFLGVNLRTFNRIVAERKIPKSKPSLPHCRDPRIYYHKGDLLKLFTLSVVDSKGGKNNKRKRYE